MSANFYELLKYAATGQASPGMTYYDRMRASALMGVGAVQTLTGIPPLSFKSNGKPLVSWSMKGNTQQTGTPTPDNPVMPQFVGVRTGNLVDIDNAEWTTGISVSLEYTIAYSKPTGIFVKCLPRTTYTIAKSQDTERFTVYTTESEQLKSGTQFSSTSGAISSPYTFTTGENDRGLFVYLLPQNATQERIAKMQQAASTIMLNSGSTALPYEPYGWKIPFTCAGQTVPIYLGQTQTVRRIKKRVFDGTEAWTVWNYQTAILFYTAVFDGTGDQVMSSHFGTRKTGSLPIAGNIAYNGNSNKNMIFRLLDDTAVTTVEGFKAWLAAQYAAGTPVTVWYILAEPQTAIVNEPLRRIGDYADELHSEDAGVRIPTAKGQNTLTVDTDLQPSEMTITYRN